jgi:hypothetical protein
MSDILMETSSSSATAATSSPAVVQSVVQQQPDRLYTKGQQNKFATVLRMRIKPGKSLRRGGGGNDGMTSMLKRRGRHSAVVQPPPSTSDEDEFEWFGKDEEENRTMISMAVRDFVGDRVCVSMEPVDEQKESYRFLRVKSGTPTHPDLLVRFQSFEQVLPVMKDFIHEYPDIIRGDASVNELIVAYKALAHYDLSLLWSLYYIGVHQKRIRPSGRLLHALYQNIALQDASTARTSEEQALEA